MPAHSAQMVEIDGGIAITWPDGRCARFPYIWLRDNDPAELHPDTHERLFDLGSVPLNIRPAAMTLAAATLNLQWPGRTDLSSYPLHWLWANRPEAKRYDPAEIDVQTWDAATWTTPHTFNAAECRMDPATLLHALETLKRFGIIIVNELPDETSAGESFGDLIGFKRETNFGVMFEVINRPEPNNLAYTALALPLHTDLPNQRVIPGYQFLHCYKDSSNGGASVFADGFHVCEALKTRDADAFRMLSTTAIPFRFHDSTADIRMRRKIIEVDEEDRVTSFAFNAHIADIPDLPYTELIEFYAAYQSLILLMREPSMALQVKLKPGEMAVFDNTRVLHGRTEFNYQGSTRHLRGYYIEKNEVDSRMRVLSQNENGSG